MQLIHQPRAKKGVVQFSPTFTDQTLYSPVPVEPAHGRPEINMVGAAYDDFVGSAAELGYSSQPCPAGGQDQNRRKTMVKNLGLRLDRGGTADHDPDIELRQTTAQTPTPVAKRARPQINRLLIGGARPNHDRVHLGSQLEQTGLITPTAKRRNPAIGRGDFPIGSHRHVHQNKGAIPQRRRFHVESQLEDKHGIAVAEKTVF
jgi:hypothetical protein